MNPERRNCAITAQDTAPLSSFVGAAALLALSGIYDVVAFSAALRTLEMAIRLALGAEHGFVMRLIPLLGATLGIARCAIGAVVAIYATNVHAAFEVDPLDPMVIVLAAIPIFLLAIAASVIPASMRALQEE